MATPLLSHRLAMRLPSIERQGEVQTSHSRGLPDSQNVDGRPVWEPPIFSYDHLIGEEYEQKRKAFLKYNNNDVVRTTEMLDTSIEFDLLGVYGMWIDDSERHAGESNDQKGEAFFKRLRDETYLDVVDVSEVWSDLGASEERMEDATGRSYPMLNGYFVKKPK